jgi:glycerol-3-phosphate dehydrogenase
VGDEPRIARAGGLGTREEALERLAATRNEPLDLLVVGGGITGAGTALDAASRGMRVGLVERHDFASGTSSKSSKLVHGGLRYLEQREFGLVREASMERDLLGRLAPHLVEPIPFVIPITNRSKRALFGVGLWTYDALASFKNIKAHKYLGIDETEKLVPALPKGKLQGGFLFYDSRTDDVRLVMEVLLQARRHGAASVNYARVVNLESSDGLCCAQVEDGLTGSSFEVRARRVVVAAGVWTDQLEAIAREGAEERLRPSKGIHLLFSREQIPMAEAAAFIPDADRKRMLFVIPWLDAVLVGTTDTLFEGDIDAPTVDEADRRYCLDAVNSAFGLSLTERDIAGAYAGLRPLVAGKKGATADLSRRYAIYEMSPGIVGITGGKLTTYRRMALDVVERIAGDLEVTAKSRTRQIRLGSTSVDALRAAVERRAKKLGMGDDIQANLIRCYGDRSLDVLDLAAAEGALEPLAPGHAPIAAEAVYCARAEMAVHLDDLLARRTRLALVDHGAGVGPGAGGADVLASVWGWSQAHRDQEVARHQQQVQGERGVSLEATSAVLPAG